MSTPKPTTPKSRCKPQPKRKNTKVTGERSEAAFLNRASDHGYTLRGSLGYTFNKWYYVRASYETRYFKFASTSGNPNDLYNWKSNLVTGGVGIKF